MVSESLLEKRSTGFWVITLVYIIAGVAGVMVYHWLHYDFWLNLLLADIAATILVFLGSCIFRNASVYDPYWSVQPPVILVLYALKSELTFVRLLLLMAVLFWSIRLTGNWAWNFYGLSNQDWRYTMLQQKTGKLYPAVNFLGIHLFPTLVVYMCTLPAVVAMREEAVDNIGTIVFFLLSVAAVFLQLTADRQMMAFRRQKNGRLIDTGLWKYSRHPNYLGEILMWWGVALSVVCVLPQYWYLCAGAMVNTLMFLFISIPMAENRQSAKPGFAEYKAKTRMLLPIRKRV